MLPMLLGVIIAVLASGSLVSAVGYYAPFMILGTVLATIGAGLLTTFSPSTSSAALILFPAVFGLGIGLSFQQPIIAAQTVLSTEDIPIGTTVIVFGQSIGAAIVISVAETIFANRLADNIEAILGPVEGVNAESLLKSATSGSGAASSGKLLALIQKAGGTADDLLDAYSKAITQSFYVGLALAALGIFGAVFIEWRSVKKPGQHLQSEEEAALQHVVERALRNEKQAPPRHTEQAALQIEEQAMKKIPLWPQE